MIERHEPIGPGPGEALAGLLGVPIPDAADPHGLPLLWHWLHLLDRPAQADLGPDGHPLRGGVVAPPEPGRRRMWAAGSVRQHAPLRLGETATRVSQPREVKHREGPTGPTTWVTVGHEIRQGGRRVLDEDQVIVYRAAPPAPPAPPATPAPGRSGEHDDGIRDAELRLAPEVTLLMRFSALTYNAHRIHYDRAWATDVEGYPGLVVHGPLQAIAMAEATRALGVSPVGVRFDYRLVAPLFEGRGLRAGATLGPGAAVSTIVTDDDGRVTARGTLTRLSG